MFAGKVALDVAFLLATADAYGQSISSTIQKTEKIGNWNAAQILASEPSIFVTLPSNDGKAIFAIKCLTNLKRWTILLTVPGGSFFQRGTFEMTLKEPRGAVAQTKLYWQASDTLYAFFDRDKSAVFQTVRWFTIFETLDLLIKQQFPDPELNFQFTTAGAKTATAIPVARCSPN